mgnify:CR=1 FL=1
MVSGTPLYTSIDDLHGELSFLKVIPFCLADDKDGWVFLPPPFLVFLAASSFMLPWDCVGVMITLMRLRELLVVHNFIGNAHAGKPSFLFASIMTLPHTASFHSRKISLPWSTQSQDALELLRMLLRQLMIRHSKSQTVVATGLPILSLPTQTTE